MKAHTTTKQPLSVERLREVLNYCAETGVFTWKLRISRRIPLTATVGSIDREGRLRIKIDGRHYVGARLAWFYQTGKWPINEIDHRNCDKADNSFDNLREATRPINAQNVRLPRAHNKLGVLGVRMHYGKFSASIKINGRDKKLGVFASAEEAHAAYVRAKAALHPGNTLELPQTHAVAA